MLTYLFAAFIIIVIALVIVLTYYLYYTRTINRQLKNRQTLDRKLLSPASVGIMMIIATLFAVSVATMVIYYSGQNYQYIDDQYEEQYHFQVYSPAEMDKGYLRQFSIESNEGYEKHEEIIDDVKFTYFTSQDSYDTYHPSFIVYAEYIGEKNVLTYSYDGYYLTEEYENIAVKIGSDAYVEDYICILGNTPTSSIFLLSVYYCDPEEISDKYNDPEYVGKGEVARGILEVRVN